MIKSLPHAIVSYLLWIIVWVSGLAAVAFWTQSRLPFTPTFPYYNEILTTLPPSLAPLGFFDGIHYLRLARGGYSDTGTQAFFPIYPLALRGLGSFGIELELAAVILNFVSLFGALVAIRLLTERSFPVFITLFFPTSFFLGMVYTESLFLSLTLIFFLSLKAKHYWFAALVAGLASGTRLVGGFLGLSLLLDYVLTQHPRWDLRTCLKLGLLSLLSVSGLLGYLFFLWVRFDDPLMFFHVQSMFGAERSASMLISPPQVLVRYLKMILTVAPGTWLASRIWLELLCFLGGLWLTFRYRLTRPWSWTLYLSLALLLPSLTGTLSSVPRYVLTLIPLLWPTGRAWEHWSLLLGSLALLGVLFSLYTQGLFVA